MSSKPHARSTSGPDKRVYRVLGFALLFLILATIVFVFVKTLVFDQPIKDQALRQALVAASVGVTLSCLVAWVLDLLEIIELRPGWSKLLWGVLVTSILATSAVVYKQFAAQGSAANAVSVACVRSVAIDPSTHKISNPVAIINQERYKKMEAFGFVITLRNVQTDLNGDYSLDIRWEFDDGTKATFNQIPYSANAQKLKADPERRKRLEVYQRVMPECIDQDTVEVLVLSNLLPTDQQTGTHQLNITVYDNGPGHGFARATLPTTIDE